MSLSVDFINVKKLHDEAQKARNEAWVSKARVVRELMKTKDKYGQRIKNLNKGNNHNYISKRYEYLNEIQLVEDRCNIICDESEEASNILQTHKENLDAIKKTVCDFVRIPRYCRNNVEIQIEPFGVLSVFSNKPGRRLYGLGHGHVILNGYMITYNRPIDAPHGRQNIIQNGNNSSILASQELALS